MKPVDCSTWERFFNPMNSLQSGKDKHELYQHSNPVYPVHPCWLPPFAAKFMARLLGKKKILHGFTG